MEPKTDTLREKRWWMLFASIHAPKDSKLRREADKRFVEISEVIETKTKSPEKREK